MRIPRFLKLPAALRRPTRKIAAVLAVAMLAGLGLAAPASAAAKPAVTYGGGCRAKVQVDAQTTVEPCLVYDSNDNIYGAATYSGPAPTSLYIDLYLATPGHLGAMVAQHELDGSNAVTTDAFFLKNVGCNETTYLVAVGFWRGGTWHGLWESPIYSTCIEV